MLAQFSLPNHYSSTHCNYWMWPVWSYAISMPVMNQKSIPDMDNMDKSIPGGQHKAQSKGLQVIWCKGESGNVDAFHNLSLLKSNKTSSRRGEHFPSKKLSDHYNGFLHPMVDSLNQQILESLAPHKDTHIQVSENGWQGWCQDISIQGECFIHEPGTCRDTGTSVLPRVHAPQKEFMHPLLSLVALFHPYLFFFLFNFCLSFPSFFFPFCSIFQKILSLPRLSVLCCSPFSYFLLPNFSSIHLDPFSFSSRSYLFSG